MQPPLSGADIGGLGADLEWPGHAALPPERTSVGTPLGRPGIPVPRGGGERGGGGTPAQTPPSKNTSGLDTAADKHEAFS